MTILTFVSGVATSVVSSLILEYLRPGSTAQSSYWLAEAAYKLLKKVFK